jgi:putative ABC transport system permease protein
MMFKSHLKIALRNIIRHKGYSFINIAGLAVGMVCCILILLWVQEQLSYDRFHENTDNLYRVAITNEARDWHGYYTPGNVAEYLRNEVPEVEAASVFSEIGSESKIAFGETSFLRKGAFVDPSFLEMFSFPFVSGDPNTVFSDPFSIVITEDLAKAIFGDDDPIGRSVKFDDLADFDVSGVMRDVPSNSHIQFDFLLSFEIAPRWLRTWSNKCLYTYVQLHENTSHLSVSEKISGVYNDHNPGAYKNFLYLQPIADTHLYNLESWWQGKPKIATYVYILSAIAIVIMLIACINFMNLSTARSVTRAREIGIRKVVGSRRSQLVSQFLCESILISAFALILAIGLAELLLPSLNRMLDARLELEFTWYIVISLVGIALVTGVIAGIYPAFYLSSFNPVAILRKQHSFISFICRSNRDRSRGRSSSLRKTLVVVQFTLSIVLIISVIVLSNQLGYIKNLDMGYDKERVVMLRLHGDLIRQSTTVKNELLKLSEVENMSLTFSRHVNWSESCGLDWDGKQPGDEFDVGINHVDYDYLRTFKMELVAGRFFSKEFPADASKAFVINEAAARAMDMDDPVGQQISLPCKSRQGTIIGVVKDFRNESAHKEIRPFTLLLGDRYSYMNIRLKSDDIRGTLGSIRNKIREFVPDDPFAYSFLDEEIDNLYRAELRTGELVTYMTLFAVFISCLGLFGLASFSVEQRTKEIAVRKVHGASMSKLVGMVSKEFLVLVTIAALIAWPIAYIAMDRWLQGFAYRTPICWWVFVLSGMIALCVALVTISYQSIRAAVASPIESLRHE